MVAADVTVGRSAVGIVAIEILVEARMLLSRGMLASNLKNIGMFRELEVAGT